MRLKLPDGGLDVKITVIYSERLRKRGVHHETTVRVEQATPEGKPTGLLAEGKSSCSPLDHYDRLIGRKLAYCKLVKDQARHGVIAWTKNDKRAIFDKLCARYKLRAAKAKGVHP